MSIAHSPAARPPMPLPCGAPAASHTTSASQASQLPEGGCVESTEILRGQKTVAIRHNGATYRLQATRLGKLILTK